MLTYINFFNLAAFIELEFLVKFRHFTVLMGNCVSTSYQKLLPLSLLNWYNIINIMHIMYANMAWFKDNVSTEYLLESFNLPFKS